MNIDRATSALANMKRNASAKRASGSLERAGSATCVNCKYWLKQSMASGECRRHAPQVVAYTESQTKGEHGEYRESVDSHTQSEWPVTPAGEWCGEYEPQNESASRSEL